MSSLHPSHDAAAVPAPVCRATHVDELGVVALLQVVQHRSVVQVGQVGHVLALLKLGRVHLLQRRLLELLLLRAEVRAAGHERNVRAAGHERRSEQLVTSGGQSSWSRAECQSSWSRAEVRAAGHEQRSEQLVTSGGQSSWSRAEVRATGHEQRSEQLVTSRGQSSWSRAECQTWVLEMEVKT